MRYETLKDEYTRLWESMVVRSSFKGALEASAQKIMQGKERYQTVSELTGVPWFVVGLIHQMEGGCKWGTHLHNGDPLSARTVCVPARRPANGNAPFKWEDSACDALMMKNMQSIKDWSIERISFELERYNGCGYRNYHKEVLTPYLWSGTTHYARGKYVADGKWSTAAVSEQSGAMPLLKTLMALDPSIQLGAPPVEVKPEPQPTEPESFKKADEKQVPVAAKVGAAVGAGGAIAQAAPSLPSIPAPPKEAIEAVTGWQNAAETLLKVASTTPGMIVICGILIAVALPWFAKRKTA
ncbi:MAG: hypothetical protein IPL32_18680 [Chloracidobacterium sp.]|nr:hypothetical protein [Chloracidobacterium sp.]